MKRLLLGIFLLGLLGLAMIVLRREWQGARGGGDIPAPADTPKTVKVAAISFIPQQANVAANADRLEKAFRDAAATGAKIAVAPEAVLDGYITYDVLWGKIPTDRMREVALPVDHPVIQRFQNLARELGICLVFGFAEAADSDIYNTAVFINDQGTICGKYRKMQFEEGYHPDWWYNRLGQESRAFSTPYGRCGILICNDRWNPALARIPKLDGAQFLVIPAYGLRATKQDEAVLARARETSLPVIEANVGVTLVISRGEIVAVQRDKTGMTVADIEIPPPVEPGPPSATKRNGNS